MTHDPTDRLDNDTADETTLVERTDTGVSITTRLKRGTGTRDEDTHTIKAKGHTIDDAIDKHAKGIDHLEQNVLDRCRALQPGEGE